MPKYLFEFNYTAAGIKGVLDKGGSAREAAGREAVESVGGTLEAYYFAFGGTDGFAICDLPDNAAAAALAMTVSSSGHIACRTVVLLTPAELDQAAGKHATYSPPGG